VHVLEHAAPAVEKVPGVQAICHPTARDQSESDAPCAACALHAPVQTSETPVPALAKPLRHAHVVAPAALVLPSGHAAHVAVPATGLYVPAVHTSTPAACNVSTKQPKGDTWNEV
jgi:hypothetical protein